MGLRDLKSKFIAALRGADDEIDEIRQKIAELAAERSRIADIPVPPDEIARRVDRAIAAERENAGSSFNELAAPGQPYDFSGRFGRAFHLPNGRFDAFGFAVWLDPEHLRDRLLDGLPAVGIDGAERARRLAEVDSEIRRLSAREEIALRQIEAVSGASAPRRPDVDPRYVLAFDDELEDIAR